MTDPRHGLGRRAEDAAARWLAARGWQILARRHRGSVGGELDLVAVDPQGVLVGIECRARHTGRTGTAAETVDPRRAMRLRQALAAYAMGTAARYAGLRVDLVTAQPEPGRRGSWRLTRLPGIG